MVTINQEDSVTSAAEAVQADAERSARQRKAWETRRARYGSSGVKDPAKKRRDLSEARLREWADPTMRQKRTEGVRRFWAGLTPEQRRRHARGTAA